MTLSDLHDTYSWQGAIDLAHVLYSLVDELPASESQALGLQIRQLAVELPAGVATDLLQGDKANLTTILKLIAALEITERIFPALDASKSRGLADALAGRLASDKFAEHLAAALPQPELELDDDDDDEAETPAAPEAAEPETEAAEPEAEPEPEAPAASTGTFNISIRPQQETNVQPDSVQ